MKVGKQKHLPGGDAEDVFHTYTGRVSGLLTIGSPPLKDGHADSIMQRISFIQHCLVVIEQCHFKISSCEETKKLVRFYRLRQ